MKHVTTIEILIQTLLQSEAFHALIVESPPGWSKSTTIDGALKRLKIPFVSMGSYTTPLHFYNTLAAHPTSMIVLDDCGFSDPKTLAILKGATWATSGGSISPHSRRISWGSTSDKVAAPCVDFSGKIILLTNALPNGKEIQAFLSRCLSFRVAFSDAEVKKMVLAASRSSEHFENTRLAKKVADFLVCQGEAIDFSQINLRTLRLGYEIAMTQPKCWQEILPSLLPLKGVKAGLRLRGELINPELAPSLQEAEFRLKTGKGRRTFYNYKKKLGLTRRYRSKQA